MITTKGQASTFAPSTPICPRHQCPSSLCPSPCGPPSLRGPPMAPSSSVRAPLILHLFQSCPAALWPPPCAPPLTPTSPLCPMPLLQPTTQILNSPSSNMSANPKPNSTCILASTLRIFRCSIQNICVHSCVQVQHLEHSDMRKMVKMDLSAK